MWCACQAHSWRSEDNRMEQVFSFHHPRGRRGPRDGTRVVRFAWQGLHSLRPPKGPNSPVYSNVYIFETGSCYVVQASFELLILLPLLPDCCGYRGMPIYLAFLPPSFPPSLPPSLPSFFPSYLPTRTWLLQHTLYCVPRRATAKQPCP